MRSLTRPRWSTGLVLACVTGLVTGLVAAAGAVVPTPAQAAEPGGPDVVQVFVTKSGERLASLRTLAEIQAVPSLATDHQPTIAPPGRTPGACPPRRCRDFRVPTPPDVTITSNKVRVFFPRGYKNKKHRKRTYPVVYFYNGARSPYYRWSEATELRKITERMKVIVVMPEGGIDDDAGMFTDWKDGSYQWETFHTEVLTAWADRRFRTKPNARAAVGASMGSLGALAYAARNPGVFQAVLSLSGAVDTNLMVANILPPELAKALGISPPDLTRVWGNPVLDRATWDAHNPVALAPKLKGVDLFIASGTGFATTESETADPLHSGASELLMWTGHRTLFSALTAADVPYTAWVRQGGVHNWPWFDAPLKWGLPKVLKALRQQ